MTTTLTSMAILKVNFDRNRTDLLDNFLPFVADRLYHAGDTAVSLQVLQTAIRDEYGLTIPGGVLKTITSRCKRKGLVRVEAGVMWPEREQLQSFNLDEQRANMRRVHEALLQRGVAYCSSIGASITSEQLDVALQSFIRLNGAPLLGTVVEGHPLVDLGKGDASISRYLVSLFVHELADSDPEGFGYFASVLKGALLACSLYFPDPADLRRKLDRLAVYLDTTILLRILGAAGPELQAYSQDIVSLARSLGVRLRYFEHTLTELQGVLGGCERALRRGATGRYSGETMDYMMAAGWGPSDVVALQESIEASLQSQGISQSQKPTHVEALTLNEARLEEVLDSEIHYRNRAALLKDIDSVTAIYRLRSGREFRQLERAVAIFVTHNTALVRGARKYMNLESTDRDTVPLCVPDFVFTTLLWLKSPLAKPELPERAILADCYAAMRPEESLWGRYLDKIDALRTTGEVSTDQYVLLRQSLPTRALLMYETAEDPEAFNEGTVQQVLQRAQDNIAKAALDDAAFERQRQTVMAAELHRVKGALDAEQKTRDAEKVLFDKHLDALSDRLARWISRSVFGVAMIASTLGAYLTSPWTSGPGIRAPGLLGFAASLAILLGAGLGLYGEFFGGSLSTLVAALERKLRRRIRAWLAIRR